MARDARRSRVRRNSGKALRKVKCALESEGQSTVGQAVVIRSLQSFKRVQEGGKTGRVDERGRVGRVAA